MWLKLESYKKIMKVKGTLVNQINIDYKALKLILGVLP